jgi:hypothetical protein
MNRSLQSILLFIGFALCASLIIIGSPYETVDLSMTDRANVVENQPDTTNDLPADNSNDENAPGHSSLQGIPSDVGQAYDLPNNMYIVRRGGTERNQSGRTLPDPIVDTDQAKVPEVTSNKAEKNTNSSTAKSESKPKKHNTTKTNDAKPRTEDELDLLARLITAEAQGEPYDTKVAVGAVVMNRVKSGEFPNTIKEVIYQNIDGYYQFTPVVNGWIDKPAHSDCLQAAKEAIGGKDPTNGALFFYSNRSTNPWLLAKPIAFKSGNMNFAY